MRILFVALEVLGPYKGGGIATALAGQAEHHAKTHDVTILYVHPDLDPSDAPTWVDHYAKRGIRFVLATFETFYPRDNIPKRAFAVLNYLRDWDQEFDVIFFHDYLGLGYYCALERQLGLDFHNTLIGTVIHGPSDWARPMNLADETLENLQLYHMERQQAEYSDFCVAPSTNILDWCREQGWTLPAETRAISNVLPAIGLSHTGLTAGRRTQVDEVCFFGRLEIRKGFFTFLDAIRYLHKNGLALPKAVTFLGPFCVNGRRHAASTVVAAAARWSVDVSMLNALNQREALTYLTEYRPLTVIPSLDESFGLTGFECLSLGVPCLLAASGALQTLPAEAERSEILFEPNAEVLARRISRSLTDGALVGAPDPIHLEAGDAWDALLRDLEAASFRPDPVAAITTLNNAAPVRPETDTPLVSVILTHHNRPDQARDAIESLRAQSYEALDIVVTDDGSTAAEYHRLVGLIEAMGDPRVRVFRQPNRYLGAARNAGVREARGAYLLFMDDDNLALPHEIETLVRVAVASGADILTCVSRMFRRVGLQREPFDVYLPIGPSLHLAALCNPFGDANALVRREVFEDLGGFTEVYGIGAEDYEFFTRAHLAGARMQLVPEILFEYRSEEAEGMMRELNPERYIVNQARGISPLLESHVEVDLATLRPLLRYAFHHAIEAEFSYWQDEGVRTRKHRALEEHLASLHHDPNGVAAVEVVAQLLVAEGHVQRALDLIEHNRIVPTTELLRRLQELDSKRREQSSHSGVKANAIANSAFEFWTLGKRFEGIHPYQYVANEWLMYTAKACPNVIVSQRRDPTLPAVTRAGTDCYMRIQNNAADDAHFHLAQRCFEFSRLCRRTVQLSFLIRPSFGGDFDVRLRLMHNPKARKYVEFEPLVQKPLTKAAWQRVDLEFDLGDVPSAFARNAYLALHFEIQTHVVNYVDLTDITLVPSGRTVTVAPYVEHVEFERAAQRCFTVGAAGYVEPAEGGGWRLHLSPVQSERVKPDSRFHVLGPCHVTTSDQDTVRAAITSVVYESGSAGNVSLRLNVDAAPSVGGHVLRDMICVTNYFEGP
ncbi:MAG: glycosyltransferase [Pseudomonadota bacterium]